MKNNTKNFDTVDSSAKAKFMAYILYMIVGSYFEGTNCLMPDLEQNFTKVYISATEKLQIFMEDKCISFVEERLLPELPGDFINSIVNVSFLKPDKSGRRPVCFETAGFKLEVKAKYSNDPYFMADLYIDTPLEAEHADETAA